MAEIYYDNRLDNYSLPLVECHDELLYSIPRDKVDYYAKILKDCFESPIEELDGVRLPANIAVGDSWATAH